MEYEIETDGASSVVDTDDGQSNFQSYTENLTEVIIR